MLPAAIVQVEHAEWLEAEGRTDEAEALAAEARPVLERLGVRPWLERVDGLLGAQAVSA